AQSQLHFPVADLHHADAARARLGAWRSTVARTAARRAAVRNVVVAANLSFPDAETHLSTRLVFYRHQVLDDRHLLRDHDLARRCGGRSGQPRQRPMILYEVNIEVDAAIGAQYRAWLE